MRKKQYCKHLVEGVCGLTKESNPLCTGCSARHLISSEEWRFRQRNQRLIEQNALLEAEVKSLRHETRIQRQIIKDQQHTIDDKGAEIVEWKEAYISLQAVFARMQKE